MPTLEQDKTSTMVLAPPGAGLPDGERVFMKWVIFPLLCSFTRPDKAMLDVVKHGHRALNRLGSVSPAAAQQCVLVERLRGMEDSSRNWSLAMTVEHLRITGEGMAHIIEALVEAPATSKIVDESAPPQSLTPVRIEDVKPSADSDIATITQAYSHFLETYPQRMQRLGDLSKSAQRHPHPWFGPLSAHQWLCLNAVHHRLHLAQMGLILKGLT